MRRTGLLVLVVAVIAAMAFLSAIQLLSYSASPQRGQDAPALVPGARVVLDAHNAYPDGGRWGDRIDRALSTGRPIGIEQDLVWGQDPRTGTWRSVVSHGAPMSGTEPSLDEHFFERVRPIIERALRENRRETWPVVTLNLDFKTNEPEHHRAVWELLGRYEPWLVTAERTRDASVVAPLRPGPLLVLTGEPDEQQRSFHDIVPVGGRLRAFGSYHPRVQPALGLLTNYRRWANYPWSAVEPEGQANAGEWTDADRARLSGLVRSAHAAGLWIRFYTLNGHNPADTSGGWTASYNFGSLPAVRTRWAAARQAGVDFIAVDQYEAADEILHATLLDGSFGHADYERLLEREFDVPPGTGRIDVEIVYDDRERTVIDLGLRGPAGVRGWSGGGQQRVFVSTHAASYGYTAGPIEPGRWAVVLGVPNIRAGVTSRYELRVRTREAAAAWPTLKTGRRWYTGDLHSHSGHSDGRTLLPDGSRVRVPAQHVFEAARRAGLDFIALTDHNTPSHWIDVDRLQASYPSMLLLHGREVTTYRGHANAFGETRFVDFRLGPRRPMAALAGNLHRAGAWLSINHPTRPDDETCMGCGWNDVDEATISTFDAVEVLNGDGEGDLLAGWRFWASMLNRGHRLVAIGGSDEHSPDEMADRRIGTPATVVCADVLSESAILDGLRRGRVHVRTRGTDGPAIDVAWSRPGELTVTTERAAGQRVEWVRRGEVMSRGVVGADGRASLALEPRRDDWFSVILSDSIGPTAFSNAVYPGAAGPSCRE